jgi:branched-chain amino acid transport system permease protein
VIALPFGLVVLRLRDVYLAIATLGFGEILRIFFINGDRVLQAAGGSAALVMFNGAEGITIPYRSPQFVAGLATTAWPLVVLIVLLLYVLITFHRSHFGRVYSAIRLDEPTAATLGIDVFRYRLASFIFSAAVAAATGALSVPIIRVIVPGNYALGRAVEVLAYAVLGGMTAPFGAVLGASLLTVLPELLRPLKDHSTVVNGLLIMAAILYFPRGLVSLRLPRLPKSARGAK